jgi:mannose-6-phosphate isomerase-like protein (cupin superfamily)
VRAGDVVWNPLSSEKALIVESGEETGGARLVADLAVEAGGFNPGGEHVHDHCTEHLEVRTGRITFTLDREPRTLGAGDRLTVAPGTWHHWRNAHEDEVLIRVRVEPHTQSPPRSRHAPLRRSRARQTP